MAKKIAELDYYDLLNLRLDASPKEVENAYILAVATYHEESLASYGVLSSEERRLILERIEEAFQTLADPATRKTYDSALLPRRPEFQQRAYFRKSTEKLEIEDAFEEEKFLGRCRSLLLPFQRLKKGSKRADKKNGRNRLSLESGSYYYGEFLKKIRQKRGIALEQIARDCNLSLDYLEALEEEDYDAFSNGKDLSRLVNLYAKCLGLDPENGRK